MIGWWFLLGSIQLIRLTYQDFKHKRMVDDRFNYFMYGVSYCLLTQISRGLFYIIGVILISIFLKKFLDKYKYFGEADSTTLSWICLGLGVINPMYLAFFFGILIIFSVLNYILMKIKKVKVAQYYHVILISFILNGVILKIWSIT